MPGGGKWQDGSNDLAAGANWSLGAVPGAGETGTFDRGTQQIITNPDQSGANQANIRVLRGFRGGWGTAGSPVKWGAMTGELVIDHPEGHDMHVWPTSVPNLIVQNSPPSLQDYGVHLYDGTIIDFWCLGGRCTRIGALANITRLWICAGARVIIDPGASIATVYAGDGCDVHCETGITGELHLAGEAKWTQLRKVGASAQTIAALYLWGASMFKVLHPTEGLTIAAGRAVGPRAIIDLSEARDATFTAAYTLLGDAFIDDHEQVVFSADPVLAGGRTRTGRGTVVGLPSWGP